MSSGNAVKLDLPPTIRVAQATFNLSQLREHVARPDALGPSAPAPPAPAFRDAGDDFWDIETIVMHELRAGGVRYLVRWQGFGPQHDTWEPQSQLIRDHGGRVAVALSFVGKELVVEGSLSASCGIVDVIDIVMRHCNRSGSVWVAWNLR